MMLNFISDEFSAKSDNPTMPKNLIKCFKSSSKPCGILLTRGDMKFRQKTQEEFTKLMNQFRKINFMQINTKKINFEADFEGAPDEDEKVAFVLLKKLPDSHESTGFEIKNKTVKVGGSTYTGKFDQSSVAAFIADRETSDEHMKGVSEQPLVYPFGRKQDALDALDKEKDKAASTERKGETKAEKRKRERERKMQKAKEEAARQKREGADTLEKSAEEIQQEMELKAKGQKLASEKVKETAATPEAKTGKKGSLKQDDDDEDIELD